MSDSKRLSVFRPLVVIVAMAGSFLVAAAAEPKSSGDQDRIVVLISLDGLAHFYLDDPRAEMPTIRSLAASGARAAMKASFPTVTWPNHTTLVTGVVPARHGVLGNNYYDRGAGKDVALISDPIYDKDEIVKTPTIYDLAHAQGLKTAAVRWPAIRNAKTIDWAVPDVASNANLHEFTTPALLAECQQLGIWEDGKTQDSPKRDIQIISDAMCLRVFLHILHDHRPNLALLHLIDVDHVQHLDGPRSPAAYEAIKTVDSQVREVWETLQRDYPNRATLLIVSDHGFAPIEHLLLPNVLLREAGLVEVEGNKATGGAVHLVFQGGSAMIYVLDRAKRDAVIERTVQLFQGNPAIWKIVGPDQLKQHDVADPHDDPRAPDIILFAKEGYGFSDAADGVETIIENPRRKGNHGHDESMPNLYATFVAWGAGIKPGIQLKLIPNTAVAPTVAGLLSLPLSNTDGNALAEVVGD